MADIVINSDRFNVVSNQCKWSEKSLNIARDLIIDKSPIADVINKYSVTASHAGMLKRRFIAKDKQLRAKEFMEREEPKSSKNDLAGFSEEIKKLNNSGYTIEQIFNFLKENNVNATEDIIKQYLKDQKK